MPNPWLDIPLEDYEGHMGSAEVGQLGVLAELFQRALAHCRPESVAVLGIAGGNGLDRIDRAITKRTVGVDINPRYLEMTGRRFGWLGGLELHCRDLAEGRFDLCAPVELVHAALIFEHAGMGAIENALALVADGGRLSMVLQLPSPEEQGVASTRYTSLLELRRDFALIDRGEVEHLLNSRGWHLVLQERRAVPAGKALWLGVFAKIS